MKWFLALLLTFLAQKEVCAANDLNKLRTDLIVKAFNSKIQNLVQPIEAANVHLSQEAGRVDINPKTKFSYYVHIARMKDPKSPIVLIPMATSRYTPTYYQTDEWWDAHKEEIEKAKREGRPPPRQDMEEVKAWLSEMKLSTNPDAIVIDPTSSKPDFVPLQKFLIDYYLQNQTKDGYITLYRGAEKTNEIDVWASGTTPKGVRYWTPTANYAWRYARKNRQFLDELIQDRAPLYKFKIPVADFKEMMQAKWPQLTLGVELTKHAHNAFDFKGRFEDHLSNNHPFLGVGRYGVEFEVRSSRSGAKKMASYYSGPISIAELARDRTDLLELTSVRLVTQFPEQANEIKQSVAERIKKVQSEAMILMALKDNYSDEVVNLLLASSSNKPPEMVNIDGIDFSSWVKQALSKRGSHHLNTTSTSLQLGELKGKLTVAGSIVGLCSRVLE